MTDGIQFMDMFPPPPTHEQFLVAYVLARARANDGKMYGGGAAEEAEKAWQKIQQLLKETPK